MNHRLYEKHLEAPTVPEMRKTPSCPRCGDETETKGAECALCHDDAGAETELALGERQAAEIARLHRQLKDVLNERRLVNEALERAGYRVTLGAPAHDLVDALDRDAKNAAQHGFRQRDDWRSRAIKAETEANAWRVRVCDALGVDVSKLDAPLAFVCETIAKRSAQDSARWAQELVRIRTITGAQPGESTPNAVTRWCGDAVAASLAGERRLREDLARVHGELTGKGPPPWTDGHTVVQLARRIRERRDRWRERAEMTEQMRPRVERYLLSTASRWKKERNAARHQVRTLRARIVELEAQAAPRWRDSMTVGAIRFLRAVTRNT